MSITLVDQNNIEDYDKTYAGGFDHMYPDLDLVRLERWYFDHKPGTLLDYGFGTGENAVHFLRLGYALEGLEGSKEALNLVNGKLSRHLIHHPDWGGRVRMQLIEGDAVRLPYDENTFDYVVCMGVLSLLALRERIELLLSEFMRVMRRNAKIIATIQGPGNLFFTKGRCVGDDVYEFNGRQGDPSNLSRGAHYIPQSESQVWDLFKGFSVDEVGLSSFKYGGVEDFRFIICARKP